MKTDFGGSHTPKESRDRWQTPLPLFLALDSEFGFYLDAAAAHNNALCSHYLTEKNDALNCEWISYGAIFCNPPYSKILPWVIKANEECRKQMQMVVMLLPADVSVKWFYEARKTADEVRFIENGRINFIPAGENKKKDGNTKGSVLFIWRPFIKPRNITNYVDRDELMSIGNKIINKTKIA